MHTGLFLTDLDLSNGVLKESVDVRGFFGRGLQRKSIHHRQVKSKLSRQTSRLRNHPVYEPFVRHFSQFNNQVTSYKLQVHISYYAYLNFPRVQSAIIPF